MVSARVARVVLALGGGIVAADAVAAEEDAPGELGPSEADPLVWRFWQEFDEDTYAAAFGTGEDVYSLKDKPAAQALINSLLADVLKSGWGEAMQKEGFSRAGYLLPWDRLFECDVKLD